MLELLKYYGDPDTLIADNDLDPALETQIAVIPEAEVKESPYQSTGKGNRLGLPHSQSRSLVQARKSTPNATEPSDRNANNEYSDQLAVVPYEPKGGRQSKSQTRARERAQAEIDKIKKAKEEREAKAKEEGEKIRIASAKRKKRLKEQIEKRKIQLGIHDRQTEGKALAILYKEPHEPEGPRPLKTKPVVFFLLEDEEARDLEAVEEFMRKYTKLWTNLFTRYQNVGFSHKNQSDMTSFDNIQNKHKAPALTFAEMTKVLKEHDVYPQLVNKIELTQMVRGCNVCLKTGR